MRSDHQHQSRHASDGIVQFVQDEDLVSPALMLALTLGHLLQAIVRRVRKLRVNRRVYARMPCAPSCDLCIEGLALHQLGSIHCRADHECAAIPSNGVDQRERLVRHSKGRDRSALMRTHGDDLHQVAKPRKICGIASEQRNACSDGGSRDH